MAGPITEKMKRDVILLSNLMDRLEETSNNYKLSGAVTLSEYTALERAIACYRFETGKKDSNQK